MRFLNAKLDNGPGSKCYLHRQTKLFDIPEEAAAQVEAFLQRVLDQGGEGVVVRNPQATWTPKRHKGILKYKPFKDAEGPHYRLHLRPRDRQGQPVVGENRCPDRGLPGQATGTRWADRCRAGVLVEPRCGVFAAANPGMDMPEWFQGRQFKRGQAVTFKYRELSDDGIPKEARYWRRRDAE